MARTTATAPMRRRAAETVDARPRSVRIGVAMPCALLRDLLVLRFDKERELELVGYANAPAAVVEMVSSQSPRVLLLDAELHRAGVERLVRQVRAISRETRVLLISSVLSEDALEHALIAGASGIVATQDDYAMLLRAIHAVARGEVWANRRATARALERSYDLATAPDPFADRLTDREREIVNAVGRGLRNKEIARQMGISEKTVKNHLGTIFRKLKVDNRFAVGLYALDIRPKT
jgi:DNA-binding NarL/FixJ family response regulator